MDRNKEIKLCMILKFSTLRKYSTLSYMHNLKTNFDKILDIAKSTLSDLLLPDGNFEPYRNKPKMTDIEVVALAITAESLGIDSENLLFSKLKKEYLNDFPRLTDRSSYNRRRKRLQDFVEKKLMDLKARRIDLYYVQHRFATICSDCFCRSGKN